MDNFTVILMKISDVKNKQGLCQDSEAPTINEQTIQSEEEKTIFPLSFQFTTQPYRDFE